MLPVLKISSRPEFDLSEYNIDVVKAMLQFMYTGYYSSPRASTLPGELYKPVDIDICYEPCFHIMMYSVAEAHDIDGLKSISMENLALSEREEQDKSRFRERVMALWFDLPHVAEELTDKVFELTSLPSPSLNGRDSFSLPLTPPLDGLE